jgi:uncharacterized protein YbjT (DUF2867 family)
MKTALVIGATGLVGSHCLQLLLADDSYNEVRVLARKPALLEHPKLRWSVVDMGRLSDQASLFAVDEVYCCLGTTIKKAGSRQEFRKVDYEYPLDAARAALMAGVRRFLIVTSLGADPDSRVYYSRVKGDVEQALVSIRLPSLNIFRPSFLVGARKEVRVGEKIAGALFRLIGEVLVGPLRKYRPIDARVVAQAMVRAAARASSGVHVFESDHIQMLGSVLPRSQNNSVEDVNQEEQ